MICASWTCVTPLGEFELSRIGRGFNRWRLCIECRRVARHIQCLKCGECGGQLRHTGQKIYCGSCTELRDMESKRRAADRRNEKIREMKLIVLD